MAMPQFHRAPAPPLPVGWYEFRSAHPLPCVTSRQSGEPNIFLGPEIKTTCVGLIEKQRNAGGLSNAVPSKNRTRQMIRGPRSPGGASVTFDEMLVGTLHEPLIAKP